MTAVTCPRCGNDSEVALLIPGVPITCGSCGSTFAPGGTLTTQQSYQTPAVQPVIVVSHSAGHRPQARLQSSGWFSRAFATTSGILAAIMAFTLLATLLVAAVLLSAASVAKTQPPAKVSRSR